MVGGVYRDEAQATAESAALAEIVPSAATRVGSIVRTRRGLRSAMAFVIGLQNGEAEVVWPNGEIALCPLGRIKETVALPGGDVRSVPGRLIQILAGKSAEPYLTEASASTVRARVDELTKSREHAIGLLLDRGPLSLSMADCLALPIEPWRVRYEFLASAAASSWEAVRLAGEIVADPSAPIGIRIVVALKFSLPVEEIGADANIVFGGRPELGDYSVLSAAAVRLSHSLGAAGVRMTQFLRTAVTDPFHLAPYVKSAAVLAALERPLQPGGHLITVGSRTPPSVVDDLIDRGVPIEIGSKETGTCVDGNGVTLATYVRARTDPTQLTSEDVLALRFGAEAVRRYLAGAPEVEPVLPPESVGDVKELRAVITGSGPVGSASNPLVQELRDVLASRGQLNPSEELLADRSVWRALIDASITGSASTGLLGEAFAGLSALTRAATALFEWRWDEAKSIARDGLREARREEVRDELLNIMACSLWLQGYFGQALAALDSALEGAYSDALLVNASVIATEMEHDSAVERLVKLAREAPSAQQRAVAAERALILWINDVDRIWEEDEDDDSLPTEIRDALRPLIRERLPEDRYLRLLRVLANRDDEWLSAQPDSAFGPNAGRAAVGIFKARATGIDEFAEALATELRNGNREEWVAQERDSVVDAAINVLFERNDELSAASFGLTLIDAKLPMRAEQRVPLKCLTVTSITSNVNPDDSEPNLRFIDFVAEAHRELTEVDPDDRERLKGLVGIAAERLARSYFASRYRQFDDVIDAYNMMMGKIREIPSRNLNKQAVREAFEPINEFCRDTYGIFNRLRPLIDDEELDEGVVAMMSQASDMAHRIAAVTR